jgi:hypothetical protein
LQCSLKKQQNVLVILPVKLYPCKALEVVLLGPNKTFLFTTAAKVIEKDGKSLSPAAILLILQEEG